MSEKASNTGSNPVPRTYLLVTLAECQKNSVPQFVVEHVFDSLSKEKDSSHVLRAVLQKSPGEKEEELRKVRRERNLFKELSEEHDAELKLYRSQQ
jgi:hypothetical protein